MKQEIHPLVKWLNEECTQVQSLKQPLTNEQAEKLIEDFTKASIRDTFEDMDNKVGLKKKYMSANRTFRSWIRLNQQRNHNYGVKSKQIKNKSIYKID